MKIKGIVIKLEGKSLKNIARKLNRVNANIMGLYDSENLTQDNIKHIERDDLKIELIEKNNSHTIAREEDIEKVKEFKAILQVGKDGVWLIFPKFEGEKEYVVNLNSTFQNTSLGNQALQMMMKQLNVKKKERKVRKIINNLDAIKALAVKASNDDDGRLVLVWKCTRAVPKSTSIGRLGYYVQKSELNREEAKAVDIVTYNKAMELVWKKHKKEKNLSSDLSNCKHCGRKYVICCICDEAKKEWDNMIAEVKAVSERDRSSI